MGPGDVIRLYVLEDHPIVVDGLKKWFMHRRDNIRIEGWCNDPAVFAQTVPGDTFDIIILDLWFPDLDPLENLYLIQKQFPGKPVVILTNEQSIYWINLMIGKGARAYLKKDVDRKEFKATIEKVYRGMTVIPGFLTDIHEAGKLAGSFIPKHVLLPSERSIVMQLSRGVMLKDIARKRCTTISNIEKTLKHLRKKLGVKTNPELIRVLIEEKLL